MRWRLKYVNIFKQLFKWSCYTTNVKEGQMAICLPLKGHIGRISALHPGRDSVFRVVNIRTKTSSLKRLIVKLCSLPSR
ncbi:hypothetical protein PR048_017185 [Dryococelus australis]|uniref:DUF5641 domain-containing protein n=1 Tax=Dryococelus australis TaxID=614101 RepID=A0ABQ9H8V3_9NEOP|nr:hypothetical protein PR048_017185 [Dryococelus australis]